MTLSFVIKRILYSLSVLWGVVTLVFVLFNALPGDPARLTMGQRSDVASLENVRKELNLDKPLMTRYGYYLNDLLPLTVHASDSISQQKYQYASLLSLGPHYDLVAKKPYFGRSYQSKRLVWDILSDSLPGTFVLATAAMIIATAFGILLGILAALKQDTFWDFSAIFFSVIGISAPSFFAGLIIAYVFGYLLSDITGLQMVGSLWEYDPFGGRRLAIGHLILPAITLGIRPLAIIAQLTRSAMLDVLSQDYIRTAYAKGLSKSRVVFRHALPNALNPVVTAISGWFAELLAGSFFVEFIFSWKGLGKLTVDALDKFDFPVVMGAVLISATIFVVISTLTDLLYTRLDPRVKLN
ncbi:MAG: ABC transporter permease [Sphingobacteriales bacterium]|nr:MAG: ABC transporter permease [Sphingobacteriales bacterium]